MRSKGRPDRRQALPGMLFVRLTAATDAPNCALGARALRSLGPCCRWMEERRLGYGFVARARSGVEMARGWSR